MRHPETALVDYARGALDPAAHERVARHLAGCPRCRQEMAACEAVLRAVAQEIAEQPQPDWAVYRAQLMRKVAARQAGPVVPQRRWSPLLTWGTLAAGAAAAAVLLTINLRPRETMPPADQFAIEDTLAGTDVGLLRNYPVIEHLDLIENYDVIEHLDELSPASHPANETRS